ncbi:hypothetical protein UM93_04380 [Psychromicrobium lacuslunae]|uniref:Uncharacterized protein n=1 Tax=Psychromicrobium lacuslunae TaxID=1618207 RepID=A0A0D4BXU1_9MICC|nr:hypothetical protein UM93_04380 [Psychromicrobium lacuslunae]
MIWVALVALSLLYVVLLGIKLWRHFVALGREVSQASDRISFSSDGVSAAAERTDETTEDTTEETSEIVVRQQIAAIGETSERREPGWAIHADPEMLKTEYAQGKLDRRAARRNRRIARRADRGQPQSLSDLRHSGTDLTR